MIELACKALRESPEFVREQVSPLGQMHLLQTLTALVCSEGEAAEIIETAGQVALANTPHPEIKTMNDLIQAPLVTEADVLSGVKTFPVRTRKGAEQAVTVRAVSWRTYMRASHAISQGENVAAMVAVLRDQAKPLCDDAFLDGIAPPYLPVIVRLAMNLSSGVDDLKRQQADKATDSNG